MCVCIFTYNSNHDDWGKLSRDKSIFYNMRYVNCQMSGTNSGLGFMCSRQHRKSSCSLQNTGLLIGFVVSWPALNWDSKELARKV